MGNCLSEKTKGSEYVDSKANVQQLKDAYDIDMKVLGAGSFGKVFLAKSKKDASIKVAVKVIKKTHLSAEDLLGLRREVSIMSKVDHPSIVKYYETYDDKRYIYLVMELCTGGELFTKITETGKPMKEAEAAVEMSKLLRALQHCHSQNIIHRDIKPENIMYGDQNMVKFIDFGFAIQNS